MKYIKLKHVALLLLISGILLGFWFLGFGHYLEGDLHSPSSKMAAEFQPFFSGIVTPLLTLGSALLVYENLRNTSRQNFSNNFLKLIEMHHKLRDGIQDEVFEISARDNRKKSVGKVFFDDLAERICFDYRHLPLNYATGEAIDINDPHKRKPNTDIIAQNLTGKEKLICIYDYYFHIYQSELGHYFRNLYYLVKYAEDSTFSNRIKFNHVKILRAQLSNYELLLLGYNCLHPYGKRFYELVEKYELLKSLNDESRLSDSYERRIVDLSILKESYPHLLKAAEFSKDSYGVNKWYFWKKVKIGNNCMSLFLSIDK